MNWLKQNWIKVGAGVLILVVLVLIANNYKHGAQVETPSPSIASNEQGTTNSNDQEYDEFSFEIAQRLYKAKQDNTISKELTAIEDEFGKPAPTSFIDGDFNSDFLDYFVNSTYAFWNPANANKSDFTFQIFHEVNKAGDFSIVAWPNIEGWSLIGGDEIKDGFVVSATARDRNGAMLGQAGPVLEYKATPQSEPFEYNLSQPIAKIYPLDFYDYDDDGKDEIGLRYTVTGADGFWQYLTIFKTDGQKLKVLKNFPSDEDGRGAEGIARRVGNIVEVGSAFSGDNSGGHLGYDKYLIEKYQFKNGSFVKIGEETIAHPLLTTAWKNYLLK